MSGFEARRPDKHDLALIDEVLNRLRFHGQPSFEASHGAWTTWAAEASTREELPQFESININPNDFTNVLVVDVDLRYDGNGFPQSLFVWEKINLPPNLGIMNPMTGKCHLWYILAAPVTATNRRGDKVVRYSNDVVRRLRAALGDPAMNGIWTKNPLCDKWAVHRFRDQLYTLDEIARAVPSDMQFISDEVELVQEGASRNCDVFNSVRFTAYRLVSSYRAGGDVTAWHRKIFELVDSTNRELNGSSSKGLLEHGEVRRIARSISAWVWENGLGYYVGDRHRPCDPNRERKIQFEANTNVLERRRQGQRYVAEERARTTHEAILAAREDHPDGTQVEIARLVNRSERTVRTYWARTAPTRVPTTVPLLVSPIPPPLYPDTKLPVVELPSVKPIEEEIFAPWEGVETPVTVSSSPKKERRILHKPTQDSYSPDWGRINRAVREFCRMHMIDYCYRWQWLKFVRREVRNEFSDIALTCLDRITLNQAYSLWKPKDKREAEQRLNAWIRHNERKKAEEREYERAARLAPSKPDPFEGWVFIEKAA